MPFIGNIGPGELIIVLVIALVVLGPGRLPEVGSALGKSIREFRKAATDVKEATSLEPIHADPPPAPGQVSSIAPAAPIVPPAAPIVPPAAPVTAPPESVEARPGNPGPETPAS